MSIDKRLSNLENQQQQLSGVATITIRYEYPDGRVETDPPRECPNCDKDQLITIKYEDQRSVSK